MITEWVWRLPFMQRERVKIFIAAQKDLEDGMKETIDKRSDELAKDKLTKLLTVVDPKLIVSFSKDARAIYIGGERVEDSRLANLRAESEAIMGMEVWQLIFETPKRLAEKALFEDDGDSKVVHTKGRAILYCLDTQKRILDVFKSYQQVPK